VRTYIDMNFIPFSGVENSLLNFFKRLNTPCLSIYIVALIYDLYSTLRGAQFRLTLKKTQSLYSRQPACSPRKILPLTT